MHVLCLQVATAVGDYSYPLDLFHLLMFHGNTVGGTSLATSLFFFSHCQEQSYSVCCSFKSVFSYEIRGGTIIVRLFKEASVMFRTLLTVYEYVAGFMETVPNRTFEVTR